MIFPMAARKSNELIEPRVSFENIPLNALRQKSSEKLSMLLNAEKVLVTEDGYYRDWRGLFRLTGLTQSEFTLISQAHDKTSKLLDLWLRHNKDNNNTVTLSQLVDCFGIIDRYDITDDTFESLTEDAKAFLSKPSKSDVANGSSYEIVKADPDNDIITSQDWECHEKGLPLPTYDAFVIYNDKDIEFASDLMDKCEKMGYSLCIKDHLLGGVSFESDAILNLLSQRCNRLIIVVSKALLNSPMQIFITNFAQALGIEQGKRKIIPCLVEECALPPMLRYCFRLDYHRQNKLFNFWDKLDQSLKVTTVMKRVNKGMERESITEIDAASYNLKVNIPTTPGPLYDNNHVYKFTETPTPESSEISSKVFFIKNTSRDDEVAKQIMPPAPKLRSASSMHNLNIFNGDSVPVKNKLSQSTFHLNNDLSNDAGLDAVKAKRKKWYDVFKPPSSRTVRMHKESTIEELPEIKEAKDKRPWYKLKKKKKDKQKNKVAIPCES